MKATPLHNLESYDPDSFNRFYFLHIPKTSGVRLTTLNGPVQELPRFDHPQMDDEHTLLPNGKTFRKLKHAFCSGEVYDRTKSAARFCSAFDFPFFNRDDTFVFTIVRNPFDLLCSYFHHHRLRGSSGGWGGCNHFHKCTNFERFLRVYCSKYTVWHVPILHGNLYAQMFDTAGKCHVHVALRYERMAQGLRMMNERFGLTFDWQDYDRRVNSFEDNQTSKNQNYKHYYSDEMVELVQEKCARELSQFGYNFDGPTCESAFVDPRRVMYNPILPNEF